MVIPLKLIRDPDDDSITGYEAVDDVSAMAVVAADQACGNAIRHAHGKEADDGGPGGRIVLHQPFRWIWIYYLRSNLVGQCRNHYGFAA